MLLNSGQMACSFASQSNGRWFDAHPTIVIVETISLKEMIQDVEKILKHYLGVLSRLRRKLTEDKRKDL